MHSLAVGKIVGKYLLSMTNHSNVYIGCGGHCVSAILIGGLPNYFCVITFDWLPVCRLQCRLVGPRSADLWDVGGKVTLRHCGTNRQPRPEHRGLPLPRWGVTGQKSPKTNFTFTMLIMTNYEYTNFSEQLFFRTADWQVLYLNNYDHHQFFTAFF